MTGERQQHIAKPAGTPSTINIIRFILLLMAFTAGCSNTTTEQPTSTAEAVAAQATATATSEPATPTAEATPTIEATATPAPSPTSEPVAVAEDEVLLLMAGFPDGDDYGLAGALQAHIERLALADIRLVLEPAVQLTGREEAEETGRESNASLIIWGTEEENLLVTNILRLQEPGPRSIELAQSGLTESLEPFVQFASWYQADLLDYLSLYILTQAEIGRGNLPRAIELLEMAMAAMPAGTIIEEDLTYNAGTNHLLLGNLNLIIGDLSAAISHYDQSSALLPEEPAPYIGRSLAYLLLGELELALADAEQAIALAPDEPRSFVNRGSANFLQGNYEQALADYEQAIALDPELPLAYLGRANALYGLKRYGLAFRIYGEAIELDPNFTLAYYHRGIRHMEQWRQGEALEDLSQAIALDPDFAAAYLARGQAYTNRGRHDEALADFDQAVALDPQSPQATSCAVMPMPMWMMSKPWPILHRPLLLLQTPLCLKPTWPAPPPMDVWENVNWRWLILNRPSPSTFQAQEPTRSVPYTI